MKAIASAIIFGAACVEGFAPSPLALSGSVARNSAQHRRPLALRMEDKVEVKPLVDKQAIDYASEPTLFQRQGFVDSGVPSPKIYNPALGGGDGFGGLSRREAIGSAGAAAVGLVGVIWAVTRNPGYDRKDTSRDAGKTELNAEVFKAPEVQASLTLLTQSRDTLSGLAEAFKADSNLALSGDVRKKFDIVKLRDAMNKLTFALEEDVQVKTDNIVRSIIQVCNSTSDKYLLKSTRAETRFPP